MEVIELSQTELASPIVLAPTKDSTLIFDGGYRNLNAVIVRDFYRILHVNEGFDLSRDTTILSALDANSSFGKSRFARIQSENHAGVKSCGLF